MIDKKEAKKLGIDLNFLVYVKLTKKAKAVYYDQRHEENKALFISKGLNERMPTTVREDENGFSEFQLWEFIEFFRRPDFGNDMPTVDGKIYFNKDELSPLDLKEGAKAND